MIHPEEAFMSREIYNKISSIKWGYLVKLFLIIIYSYPN